MILLVLNKYIVYLNVKSIFIKNDVQFLKLTFIFFLFCISEKKTNSLLKKYNIMNTHINILHVSEIIIQLHSHLYYLGKLYLIN